MIREDPQSHDLLFAYADGEDFYRLSPPPGYDPLNVLTPALLARRETLLDTELAEFDRAYRADRIRLRVRLLRENLIPAYLVAQRQAEGVYATGDWPDDDNRWHHSDIKRIAYTYNSKAFDQIVNDGSLK